MLNKEIGKKETSNFLQNQTKPRLKPSMFYVRSKEKTDPKNALWQNDFI